MTDTTPTATPENIQQFSFKAETKQLLNILIHSLYKDREVFLRELLSNASDALNRLRFEMVTNQDVLDPAAELAIRIKVDKDARMLTIQDTGIGMTKDEIIENLGTIAQSGARKFLEATKDRERGSDAGDRPVRRRVLFRVHGGGMGAGHIAFLPPESKSRQLVCDGRGRLPGEPGRDERTRHEGRDQTEGRCRRVCGRISSEEHHSQAFRVHWLPHLCRRGETARQQTDLHLAHVETGCDARSNTRISTNN